MPRRAALGGGGGGGRGKVATAAALGWEMFSSKLGWSSLSFSSGLIRFLKRFRREWYLDRLIGSVKRLHLGTARFFSLPSIDSEKWRFESVDGKRIGICLAQQQDGLSLIYRAEGEGVLLEYRIARGEPVRLTISAVDIDICNCCVTVALRMRESQVIFFYSR